MAEITATTRQLLDQIGLSTPAELTSEQATNPHNPLLQLVNDLLKEALAEAGRAERAFGRRLRYLDQALYAEQHLLDQGADPHRGARLPRPPERAGTVPAGRRGRRGEHAGAASPPAAAGRRAGAHHRHRR